jgi:hypothetical protein
MGETCLAKYWEDGQFYQVDITGLSKNTAVVFYKDFGNHEEVLLEDLAQFHGNNRQRGGGGGGGSNSANASASAQSHFIPATPGLPPAFPQ